MPKPVCRLECQWSDVPGSNGRLDFAFFNLTDAPMSGFEVTYTTLTRANDLSQTENCTLKSRFANNHLIVPPADLVLQPGERWDFYVLSLTRIPGHRTDGINSGYVTLADGTLVDFDFGEIMLKGKPAEMPPRLIPEGRVDIPVSLIPWPNSVSLTGFEAAPVALYPEEGNTALVLAMAEIGALTQRLFANAIPPFSLTAVDGGRQVAASAEAGLGAEAYVLSFTAEVVSIRYGDKAGLHYALTSLSQMILGAHDVDENYSFPIAGEISDQPRYSWRGCHLDVSRQFYSFDAVKRFVDILAWNKMSIFHWHLTDDEGWRLEIKAYPELTDIGARRGPGEKLPAQLGTGSKSVSGHYTQEQVAELVADAARLNIEIVPEFDIPGHCAAVLASLPYLIDEEEEKNSYVSVQGYPNNALNPALEETFTFLDTVFKEVAALFPSKYVHVGGDEVAHGAWLKSPKAQALMKEMKLDDTPQMQSYLLGRAKQTLNTHGKVLAGWDEVSHGGGVDPENSLLMAWQKPEIGIGLAREGYDVVMCPGQAYYLDMVQDEAFLEPGLSWAANAVPPELTYNYEAAADFPEDLRDKLKGIQGCIWSENLTSRARFNHMVFPRLSAIAEAGWTQKENKDWLRFAAIQRLMPIL